MCPWRAEVGERIRRYRGQRYQPLRRRSEQSVDDQYGAGSELHGSLLPSHDPGHAGMPAKDDRRRLAVSWSLNRISSGTCPPTLEIIQWTRMPPISRTTRIIIIRWTDAEGQGAPPNSFSNIVEWLRNEAAGIADYYVSAGITNNTDYLFIDRYGIDAASAGYVTNPASSTWFWNHDHWNNYLAFVESVQQQVRLPIVLWQLPI